MKHKYLIYTRPESIAATIESDGPLPHLKVGGSLILESDNYHAKQGFFLEIEREEIVMSYIDDKLVRNDIYIYCTEREKTSEL